MPNRRRRRPRRGQAGGPGRGPAPGGRRRGGSSRGLHEGGVRAAAGVCGCKEEHLHFLDLPFYQTGTIAKKPIGDDDVRVVLETNVNGTFNMTRAVLPYMISKRRGKIVNLSSVSGEKGGRGQTNYAASKGAINAFTRSLAVEVAPRGITVNAVAPGFIATDREVEKLDRPAVDPEQRAVAR